MSAFAAAFREHSVPRIRPCIRTAAMMVSIGEQHFGEAVGFVLRVAINLGAAHLPDQMFREFQDWVMAQMLREIDRLEYQEEVRQAA